jgi:hypothetical protein
MTAQARRHHQQRAPSSFFYESLMVSGSPQLAPYSSTALGSSFSHPSSSEINAVPALFHVCNFQIFVLLRLT